MLALRAGEAVLVAQFIEHGAVNAVFGVGVELDSKVRPELAESLHESERAGRNELIELYAGRKAFLEALREKADFLAVVGNDGLLIGSGKIFPGSGSGFKGVPGGVASEEAGEGGDAHDGDLCGCLLDEVRC